MLPLLFFLIFSAGIVASAGISLLFNKQVTDAVSDVFDIASDLLDSSTVWANDVKAPLAGIRDQVDIFVGDIQVKFNNTDFIVNGLDTIASKLNTFAGDTAGVTLPYDCNVNNPDPYCIPCDACTNINQKVNESIAQIESVSNSTVVALRDSRATINEELVDASQTALATLDETIDAIEEFSLALIDGKDTVSEIRKTWDEQDGLRDVGVLAMFALAIVVVVIGAVGVLFGLTPLKFVANVIHIAYFLGFFALFVGFLVSAVLIAFSILMGDICEVSELMKEDWGPIAGRDAAKGLDACFTNQSLLVAYEMEDAVDFQDMIVFPEAMNPNDTFDFAVFDQFEQDIKNTDSSTFSLDSSLITSFITLLNELTSQNANPCIPNDNNYTVDNIVTPWEGNNEAAPNNTEAYLRDRYSPFDSASCSLKGVACTKCTNFSQTVIEVWKNASTLREIEIQRPEFLNNMKQSMEDINDYIDSYKNKVAKLDADIQVVKANLTDTLYQHVEDFKAASFCNFISDRFDDLQATMCGDLMPAILMVSFLVFLMSLFLIPVNICLIILCKRLRATSSYILPDGEDEETEFK